MGSCNCADRVPEQETKLDLPGHSKPKAVESQQEDPSSVIIVDRPLFAENDVLYVQHAFKSYLERKRLEHMQDQMIDFEDSAEINPDLSTETAIVDIYSRLSEPAKATFRRISPLLLHRQVKNVVTLGPRLLTETGDVYMGQWAVREDGKPCRKGKGKLVTPAGALLEGYWKNGKLHLSGRIIYPNGDCYEGPFVEGVRSGKGRFETFERKAVYIGDWDEDVRQGYGIEQFEDGSRYEGAFSADSKTGKGKFSWKDGSAYDGDFIEGRLEGFGTYAWYDGRKYSGLWKSGKMNGKGSFTYKDGKSYDGEYLNDKKHGFGVYKWEGQMYEGEWYQGKMHGFGYLTNTKGRKRYEFRDGNKVREAPE